MARKSRKVIQKTIHEDLPQFSSEDITIANRTAIYARLSLYDTYREDPKSMDYQILFLEQYLDSHRDLTLIDRYIDNGETGMNYNRPAFRRLVNDINSGRINCVVVKDLSRFGRNYIETGMYLQDIFPQQGIRFIAINDGYDSKFNDADELSVILKNILNDFYSRELSRKMSESYDIRISSGPIRSGYDYFGYIQDPADKTHLIKDPETKAFTELIFEWYLQGSSYSEIARRLTAMHVPTLHKLHYDRSPRKDKLRREGTTNWLSGTVRSILKNPVYTGDTVYGKIQKRRYNLQGVQYMSPEDWTIYPDTHEPYITRDQYEQIQNRMQKNTSRRSGIKKSQDESITYTNLFTGKLICGICGYQVSLSVRSANNGRYTYPYYSCIAKPGCFNRVPHENHIRKEMLDTTVLDQLIQEILLAKKLRNWMIQPANQESIFSYILTCEQQLADYKLQQTKIKEKKTHLLEYQVDQIITKEDLALAMNDLNSQERSLQLQTEQLFARLQKDRSTLSVDNPWIQRFATDDTPNLLTQEMVILYIDKIYTYTGSKAQCVFLDEEWRDRLIFLYETLKGGKTCE